MRSALPKGMTIQVKLWFISEKAKQVVSDTTDQLFQMVTEQGLKSYHKVRSRRVIKSLNKQYEVDDFKLMSRLKVADFTKDTTGAQSVLRH